jgi:phosphate uptake regulator
MTDIRRVVQTTGGSSYAITLPKAWVSSRNIGRGTILRMKVTEDGALLIIPETSTSREPSSIEIVAGPDVGRDIVGAYLYGYDVIRVIAPDRFRENELSEVKRWARTLAGAEIIDETPNRIEIQVMLDAEAVAPEKVVRRQSVLVMGMVEDAVKALIEGDTALGRSVNQRDEEVDRHYFTLVRVLRTAAHDYDLARRLDISPLLLMDLRMAAKFIEDAGDNAASIGREASRTHRTELDGEVKNDFMRLVSIILNMGQTPIDSLMLRRKDLVYKSLAAREEFLRYGEGLVRKLAGHSYTLFKAYYSLDRICEDFSDIAELALPFDVKPLKAAVQKKL